MEIEDIVNQFPLFKGMELTDFTEVALPIYRITSTILIQEKVKLDTIEEFVLRSVSLGFKSITEIHNLLGLSKEVVRESVTQLIRADLLIEKLNENVALTSQGIESVEKHVKVRPIEKQIIFDYDGLDRCVRFHHDRVYLSPKEIEAAGLVEIRAIPSRRPDAEEIELQQVSDFVSNYSSTENSDITLLRIRKVTRSVRLFYKAVMLVYKELTSNNYEVAFCISGHLSEAHGMAFIKCDGLVRLNLLKQNTHLDSKKIKKKYSKYTNKKTRIVYKNNEKGILINKTKVGKEKTIPVFEYPKLLNNSLIEAVNSILLLSPHITSRVFDRTFVKKLEEVLEIGAQVKIGFSSCDESVNKSINKLRTKYKNFEFKQSDKINTNILIKDKDYFILTNFNWLSYKGSSSKIIVESWGVYKDNKSLVQEFYDEVTKKYFS